MRAVIRYFHSPDVHDLASHRPDTPDCFGFLLQVMVGPLHGEGEEAFDVIVCTPSWLSQLYPGDRVIVGRHKLFVFEYDRNAIKYFIEKYVNTVESETWEGVAEIVGRLGRWEFEGYQPAPSDET